MKTNKTLKTVALAGLMGSALLLTGCGGGGGSTVSTPSYTPPAGYVTPAEMGSIGQSTGSLLFDLPYVGQVSVDMSELILAESFIDSIQTGEVTAQDVWQNAPLAVKNKISELAIDAGYPLATVEYISNNLPTVSAELGTVNVWQKAADEANTIFAGNPINDREARKIFDQIDVVGATEAWAQGWTGEGVTISRASTLTGTPEALLTANAIAIGATMEVRSHESDIKILDLNSVLLQRGTGDTYTKHQNSSAPWAAGRFAGVSALVMQKFPQASNVGVGGAVSDSVVNGRYNALRALSPSL